MSKKRWMPWGPAALAASSLALVAAGCGGSAGTSAGGGSVAASGSVSTPIGSATGSVGAGTGTGASSTGTPLKVGLVTDIGGLNDRSFNHLAYVGLQRAEHQLGIQGKVDTSSSNADYIPNLSSLAEQHYDLVIGVGFLMADAMNTVATKFPDTHFAIIDVDQQSLKNKPTNVRGLLFTEQQAGYLVGYLSGLLEKAEASSTKHVIGSVGGQKIPPVDHYIAGYQAGAKAADPNVTTLNGYSQDFVDQAKCKEIALNQIGQGSDIEFQVAGGCGLGVLDAAKEKNIYGIGVDADQSYLGPEILTSAVKKVDVAVFKTIQSVRDGSFQGGADTIFDLKSGGVGIGQISPKVPAADVAKVRQVEQQIIDGKIANIPDTVK